MQHLGSLCRLTFNELPQPITTSALHDVQCDHSRPFFLLQLLSPPNPRDAVGRVPTHKRCARRRSRGLACDAGGLASLHTIPRELGVRWLDALQAVRRVNCWPDPSISLRCDILVLTGLTRCTIAISNEIGQGRGDVQLHASRPLPSWYHPSHSIFHKR